MVAARHIAAMRAERDASRERILDHLDEAVRQRVTSPTQYLIGLLGVSRETLAADRVEMIADDVIIASDWPVHVWHGRKEHDHPSPCPTAIRLACLREQARWNANVTHAHLVTKPRPLMARPARTHGSGHLTAATMGRMEAVR